MMLRIPAHLTFVLSTLLLVCAPVIARSQALPINIPTKPFGDMPHPSAPNYSDPQMWAALPERLDAADVVPENDPFGDRQSRAAVDVFYIHPTTYRGAAYWNQPLDEAVTNDWTDESVIARQAAVFNACCRVFAPRYRQASAAGVYASPEMRAAGAYEFAWQDVRAAFLHYMQHANDGRPYIIAGHSQGGAHVERWLNEFGRLPKYRRKLVAAYAIGGLFSMRTLQEMGGGIPPCATTSATGCFLSWNAFDQRGDASEYLAAGRARDQQKHGADAKYDVLCINPLTFSQSRPTAVAAKNLGSLPARRGVGLAGSLAKNIGLPATEKGRVGAECRDGILWVDGALQQDNPIVALPGGMLHFNEFDLFFMNIRTNALERSEAFIRQ